MERPLNCRKIFGSLLLLFLGRYLHTYTHMYLLQSCAYRAINIFTKFILMRNNILLIFLVQLTKIFF